MVLTPETDNFDSDSGDEGTDMYANVFGAIDMSMGLAGAAFGSSFLPDPAGPTGLHLNRDVAAIVAIPVISGAVQVAGMLPGAVQGFVGPRQRKFTGGKFHNSICNCCCPEDYAPSCSICDWSCT